MIFFIDDINMPYVDTYGTQSPIALLRQIIDYGIIFDRDNLEEKKNIQDLYFCSCLNPKAGSFTIEIRLQRHFSAFALPVPSDLIIKDIYTTIIQSHFDKFDKEISELAPRVVAATMKLFTKILRDSAHFSPSSTKFHYQFNLRDLSNVTEGMMRASPAMFTGRARDMVKLWVHECKRVFEDRLISETDIQKFNEHLMHSYDEFGTQGEFRKDEFIVEIMAQDNIFTTFISVYEDMDEDYYLPISSIERLREILTAKLKEYNDRVA